MSQLRFVPDEPPAMADEKQRLAKVHDAIERLLLALLDDVAAVNERMQLFELRQSIVESHLMGETDIRATRGKIVEMREIHSVDRGSLNRGDAENAEVGHE
jgi:hypothetical protein